MLQMNLSTKEKQTHRHREQMCGCPRGCGGGRGMVWEAGVSRCKLSCIEWRNKVLPYAQRTIFNIL